MKLRQWRSYSTFKQVLPAKVVRHRFIEYFVKENGHQLIKPSPVLPQFDSSIPFVNAGMCQFKQVFTGEEDAPCDKAANSQKCIRIGGKHNDLNLVGLDSFHHTFFEMLGNWSFGSYNKKEACSYAWQLLTSSLYSISPHRLFVTYFGGDETLNLPADDEVREIWLELGVHPDRILPFGIKENFWEMGLTGPCGTCSEIHVASTDELASRLDLVNRDNPLLSELWNIVFIKYNKTDDGIKTLSKEFIDTGMGFERLVALLQQKNSNYDTDLFQPLFTTIEKATGAPVYSGTFEGENLDASYRRLADYSRMITVAISDNAFPEINPKLRRVLRRALYIARSEFKHKSPEKVLTELAIKVSESLCEIFPEIGNNLHKVELIIKDESALIDDLIKSNEIRWKEAYSKYPILRPYSFIEYPGLLAGYQYLEKILNKAQNAYPKQSEVDAKRISSETVGKLYNTYGLDESIVEKITSDLIVTVDWDDVEFSMNEVKTRSKLLLKTSDDFEFALKRIGIKTDTSLRYNYSRNEANLNSAVSYSVPEARAVLLVVLQGGKIASIKRSKNIPDEVIEAANSEVPIDCLQEIGLIFDRTNFSIETPKRFDRGHVIIDGVQFTVKRIESFNDFVVHYVELESNERCSHKSVNLKAGSEGILYVDSDCRLAMMRNNMLGRLILVELEKMFPILYWLYDNTSDTFMNMKLCVHGKKPDLKETAAKVESQVQDYIRKKHSIERKVLPSRMELLKQPGLSLRPGFIYPTQNINVISITDEFGNIILREPCEDVHPFNVADLEPFHIVLIERMGANVLSVTATTGDLVVNVKEFNDSFIEDASKVEKEIIDNLEGMVEVEKILDVSEKMDRRLPYLMERDGHHKLWFSNSSLEKMKSVKQLKKTLDKRVAEISEEAVVQHFRSILKTQGDAKKFAVHFSFLYRKELKINSYIAKLIEFETFPTLFFVCNPDNNKLRGVCCVPQGCITENFNAEIWLKSSVPEKEFDYKIVGDNDFVNHVYLSKVKIRSELSQDIKELVLSYANNAAIELLGLNKG